MRVHLTLTSASGAGHVPINYNSYVSEFVYDLLQPDTPFRSGSHASQAIPFYAFSNLYIPEVKQEERTLNFGSVAIELTVSLLIDEEAEPEALERIHSVKQLTFGEDVGTTLDVATVEVVEETKEFTSLVRFRMLSPLASPVWDSDAPEHRYVHYTERQFSTTIRDILLAKYERWYGRKPTNTQFSIRLDEKYVQRRRGRISKLVMFHEGEDDEKRVKAIVAPFEVEGNPELIRLGYVAGFGEKNLLGFGCSDVINVIHKQQQRIVQVAPNRGQRDRNPREQRDGGWHQNGNSGPRREEFNRRPQFEREPAGRGGGYRGR